MNTPLARLLHLLALLAASLLAGPALAEPKHWSGSVELPGGIPLAFTVSLEAASGTMSIAAQGVVDKPLEGVSVSAEKITFTLANPGGGATNAVFEFTPAADGQSASGMLKQMGQEFKASMKALAAGEKPKGPARPQVPQPPFPYTAVEVTIPVKVEGKGQHTLAGTLTIPEGQGPFPAVIMVTGSGPQDRDEQLLGHKPFLVIADHLTRQGVAVLRYDDRGVGKSTGVFGSGTTEDFTDDALAAVAFAKTRSELDPKHLGIVGHSEGGLIAPMAAARSEDLSFIVLLAGPGMPSVELLALQGRLISEAMGTSKDLAQQNAKVSLEILGMVRDKKPMDQIRARLMVLAGELLKITPETKDLSAEDSEKKLKETVDQQMAGLATPWLQSFLRIDPAIALAKVKIPILALNGEKDLQVPPKENLAGITAITRKAGNRHVTTRELPGLNHLFQTCKTGAPSEYAEIEETFSPAALEILTQWIRETTGLEKPKAPKK